MHRSFSYCSSILREVRQLTQSSPQLNKCLLQHIYANKLPIVLQGTPYTLKPICCFQNPFKEAFVGTLICKKQL